MLKVQGAKDNLSDCSGRELNPKHERPQHVGVLGFGVSVLGFRAQGLGCRV